MALLGLEWVKAGLGRPPHPQPHLFHSPNNVSAAKPTPNARPKAFSGISVASLWSRIKPCLQGSSFFPQGKITECFQSAMELQKGFTRPEPAEMSPERASNQRPPHLGSGELPHHQLRRCSSRSPSPESRDPCSSRPVARLNPAHQTSLAAPALDQGNPQKPVLCNTSLLLDGAGGVGHFWQKNKGAWMGRDSARLCHRCTDIGRARSDAMEIWHGAGSLKEQRGFIYAWYMIFISNHTAGGRRMAGRGPRAPAVRFGQSTCAHGGAKRRRGVGRRGVRARR